MPDNTPTITEDHPLYTVETAEKAWFHDYVIVRRKATHKPTGKTAIVYYVTRPSMKNHVVTSYTSYREAIKSVELLIFQWS